MTTTTKTAAELRAERDALNKQIRAAERAEKKAAERALLDAQHALGEWLAESLAATTPEAVEALREVVDLDHVRVRLAGPGVTETGDSEAFSSGDGGAPISTPPESADGTGDADFSTGSTFSYGG